MRRAVIAGAFVALISTGLAAQGRSFGGTWAIDVEKTTAEGGMATIARSAAPAGGGGRGGGGAVSGSSATGTMVASAGGGARGGVARSGGAGGSMPGMSVTMDAGTFTLVQGQSTTTYRTDGSVTTLDTETRRASAKASWQGDKLVVDTTTETPNGPMVTHATWYLEAEWLVRENKSTGPDGQDVIRKTYYKKSS
jgi:hypothetical protein